MTSICILKNAPSFSELAKREEKRVADIIKNDKNHDEQERRIRGGERDSGAPGVAMKNRPKLYAPELGANRLTDGNPVDFYYFTSKSLSQRQADAGWHLTALYRQGFPQSRLVGRIGEVGRELISPEEEEEQASARKAFSELIAGLPVMSGRMISRIVRNEYPDTPMGVTHLISGLDIVADRLKFPR